MVRVAGLPIGFALLAACTMPNPAFEAGGDASDEVEGSGSSSSGSEDQAESVSEVGTTTDEASEASETNESATSEGLDPDLPMVCGTLGYPLELEFSMPANWPNMCPGEPLVAGILDLVNNQVVLRSCPGGIDCAADCTVLHPINAGGYDLSPWLTKCVTVEAAKPLPSDPASCRYSTLSVFLDIEPLFIGTTASSPPTGLAQVVLGEWPQPSMDPDHVCGCDVLGVESDCCVAGIHDVKLHSLVVKTDGVELAVPIGDSEAYVVPGSPMQYEVYNAMAQQVGTCSVGIETSWKIFRTGL